MTHNLQVTPMKTTYFLPLLVTFKIELVTSGRVGYLSVLIHTVLSNHYCGSLNSDLTFQGIGSTDKKVLFCVINYCTQAEVFLHNFKYAQRLISFY